MNAFSFPNKNVAFAGIRKPGQLKTLCLNPPENVLQQYILSFV
jgi:hypothetical protein